MSEEDVHFREQRKMDMWRALFCAIAYLALYRISRSLTETSNVMMYLITIFALVLSIAFPVALGRAIYTRRATAINLILSLLVCAPRIVIPLGLRYFPTPAWRPLLESSLLRNYFKDMAIVEVRNLLMIWCAVSIGVAITRIIKEFNILLPAAVSLALIDLYVVFGGGLVTQAQSGQSQVASQMMKSLTLTLPSVPKTTSRGTEPLILAVGFADYLFMALFFGAFRKFGIPSRRTFWALVVTLTAYMFAVAQSQTALPALVPIAVVVVGMNWRRFKFTDEERKALAAAAVIVCGVLGALVWRSKH